MKVNITSIELKSPFHFFPLSLYAMRVMKQLSATTVKARKTRGFWKMHYTMTLWENEKDLKEFARSGAHLEAMKQSGRISSEIRILTMDASELPNWKDAKAELFRTGRVLRFTSGKSGT